MHRTMCQTDADRDCRLGGQGACRRCPYRQGGPLHKTQAEKHEGLIASWYHAVCIGHSAIWEVPWRCVGGELQPTVRAQVERRYRRAARTLTDTQKHTIERMRDQAPMDIAAAAGCTVDEVWLWLLPRRPKRHVPFYTRSLELVA